MDTGTLIKVVAMIDARIADLQETWDNDDSLYGEDLAFIQAEMHGLRKLNKDLQKAIDTNVASMETSMGM